MKEELRRRFIQARGALAAEARARESQQVCEALWRLPLMQKARLLAAFRPLPAEVDVWPLVLEWATRRRALALPRVEGNRLSLHEWTPADGLTEGPFHLQEPAPMLPVLDWREADAVLVPGVAFDRSGARLGWGKGYYDRALAGLDEERLVGVGFASQLVDGFPTSTHDVRLGWVVTSTTTIRTNTGLV